MDGIASMKTGDKSRPAAGAVANAGTDPSRQQLNLGRKARPTTGIGKSLGLRLYPDEEKILDRFRDRHGPAEVSRIDAIRLAIRAMNFTAKEWEEIEAWQRRLPNWKLTDAIRAAVRLHLSRSRADLIARGLLVDSSIFAGQADRLSPPSSPPAASSPDAPESLRRG